MALHRPGKPQQNAVIESFNGRIRDELLNNAVCFARPCPRSSGDLEGRLQCLPATQCARHLPPVVYAKNSAPGTQRDGTLRYIEGFAPRPVAPPSQQGSNEARTLLIGG
jgi:putative transposase